MTHDDAKDRAEWINQEPGNYEEFIYLRRIGRMMLLVCFIVVALGSLWFVISWFE